MTPEEADFKAIGLTPPEWKAFLLGTGSVDPTKLNNARVAAARIGRYTPAQSANIELLDFALTRLGVTYTHHSLKGVTFNDDDRIKFFQVRDGCTLEEAKQKLAQIKADRKAKAEIFGDLVPDPYPKSLG